MVDFLQGPFGGPAVALVVLILEYLVVKPLIERGGSASPAITQNAVTSIGNITQNVNNSKSLIIQHFHAAPAAPSRSPGAGSSTPTGSGEEWGKIIGIGFAVLGAGAFLTWGLAHAGPLIRNVALGVGLSTALLSTALWLRHRNQVIPVGPWAGLNAVAAVATVVLSSVLLDGARKGVSLSDVREMTEGLGLGDALGAVIKSGFEVPIFFGLKAVGGALLLLVCVIVLARLTGVVAAISALNSSQPRPWHVKLVKRLFPDPQITKFAVWTTISLVLAGVLITGAYWPLVEWYQESFDPRRTLGG